MTTDPRDLGGGIAGPGGPRDRGGVLLDTSRAVLLDSCHVSTVDEGAPPGTLALQLSGRINRTQDRARVLFLFDIDGAAAIITELFGLTARAGFDADQLVADVTARLGRLRSDGAL